MTHLEALRIELAAIDADLDEIDRTPFGGLPKLFDKFAETERRERNKKHVGSINRAAMEALMKYAALSEADAKAVVIAIATSQIPAVKIEY